MEADSDLRTDPRWQLIERITASSSFQKSARLRDLLRFLTERTLHSQTQDLSEHSIGSSVFGKAQDYSVVEDSSVRVHVRQLLPWALAALFLLTTLAAWFRRPAVPLPPPPPWPLATLFDSGNRPVYVVVADINYGMTRLVDEQPVTLEQYLSPSYRSGETLANAHPTAREARVMKYLSGSLLTSYADLVVVDTLLRLSGNSSDRLAIRSARELRPRDLEEGTFVFVGSPSSNPWVSYFQDKLNFQEREGVVGESLKFFQNLHPKAGEQETYHGLAFTGSSGEDYATISLLPLGNGRGSVLILQGLQQEGTESAGLFLADAGNRQKLQQALGTPDAPGQPVYFEALIRTQAVAGAPNATSIVATRVVRP